MLKKWLLTGLVVVIVGYVGISLFQVFRYTTPARHTWSETPANQGLSFEEVAFVTATGDNVTLRGWWIPNAASRKVIILVHGRDGTREAFRAFFKSLWDRGYNLLSFDMRGHGQTEGGYCTWGIREAGDINGAVNWLKAKGFKPSNIGVFGSSIGGASAIMAMGQNSDIAAGVSDSAYANADPLLAHNFIYPGLVVGMRLFRDIDINQINPEVAITRLGTRQLLLIHGEKDSQVPLAQFYRLQKAGGANVVSWIAPNSDHAQAYERHPAEYMARLVNFFDSQLASD